MTPPKIEESTPEERRRWIRDTFPCMSNCDICGLCATYHNKDVEDVYQEYILGTRSFEEIAREYRPNH